MALKIVKSQTYKGKYWFELDVYMTSTQLNVGNWDPKGSEDINYHLREAIQSVKEKINEEDEDFTFYLPYDIYPNATTHNELTADLFEATYSLGEVGSVQVSINKTALTPLYDLFDVPERELERYQKHESTRKSLLIFTLHIITN